MWNNKNDILRDLSFAQGSYVPLDMDESIATSDPRSLTNIEDNFVDEDDTYVNIDPDCGLISQMLKTIDTDKEEEREEQVVEVNSNLNPLSEEFVPRSSPCEMETQRKRSKSIRPRFRNVAMSSILSKCSTLKENDKNETVDIKSCGDNITLNPHYKLQKENFNCSEGNDGKVEKDTVNVKGYGDNFSINPNSMFRRKTIKSPENNICNNSTIERKPAESPVKSNYKASALASNYYKKFLERQEKIKQEELLKEDIWTKLERQMKEIDRERKRKLLASTSSPSNLEDSETSIRKMENTEKSIGNLEDSEGTITNTDDSEDLEISNWRNSETSVSHLEDEIHHNGNWSDSQANPSTDTGTGNMMIDD